MIRRSYRVILEVDIEVELEDDQYDEETGPDWEAIESYLEDKNAWIISHEEYYGAYVNYAEVDSYDVGMEWEG